MAGNERGGGERVGSQRLSRDSRHLSTNYENITVSEIMQHNVITVREKDPIESVMELMIDKQYHSFPVVSDDGDLRGIISNDNILELLLFERIPRRHHTHLMAVKALSEQAGHLMVEHPITIPYNANLCDTADLMLKHHVDRICVVKEGKLVGMVSKLDLIRKTYELWRK